MFRFQKFLSTQSLVGKPFDALELLEPLNIEWLNKKKESFLQEPFYSAKLNKVHREYQEKSITGKSKKSDNKTITVDINLAEYCWSDTYLGGLRDLSVPDLPINGRECALRIIKISKAYLLQITDVKTAQIFIEHIKSQVYEWADKINSTSLDKEYNLAITTFSQNFNDLVSTTFRKTQALYDLVAVFDHPINFNLNQEELAALLYILFKAEFFEGAKYNDTRFLNSCIDHCYFKHRSTLLFQKTKGLRKRFNELNNAKNPNKTPALDRIKSKLIKTLKDI